MGWTTQVQDILRLWSGKTTPICVHSSYTSGVLFNCAAPTNYTFHQRCNRLSISILGLPSSHKVGIISTRLIIVTARTGSSQSVLYIMIGTMPLPALTESMGEVYSSMIKSMIVSWTCLAYPRSSVG
jgi:hypothetical protein